MHMKKEVAKKNKKAKKVPSIRQLERLMEKEKAAYDRAKAIFAGKLKPS